ncbi:MAG: EF-P beta-lysylation protein EpmB [Gammaproteobacteria bacterium]|nr:EF-P beta-lysylation protein EpmB [Gammaproteobacteria bacterium]MYF39055.1 EF-P beta-lysylation protein EpmB [Gammaproteobacteria bacterium]
MIHALNIDSDEAIWQGILRSSVRSVVELKHLLELQESQIDWVENPEFPLQIPRTFIQRMEKRNPLDPLLLQVAPSRAELNSFKGYTTDPLIERDFIQSGGVVKKYANRALVIATGACPVHCRYCFRRHFDYAANQLADFQKTLETLAGDPSIVEVILSGGDPLTLSTSKLDAFVQHLEKLAHIAILRIHTRFPVMIPQRITPAFVEILSKTRLKVVVVVHINHPNEIDDSVHRAIQQLRSAQIDVFNQSVLLKGVNDSVGILSELMFRVFEIGVVPYYLHVFDPVAGAHHYDTSEKTALALWKKLQAQLPGYLVPRLVREVPHEAAKTILC